MDAGLTVPETTKKTKDDTVLLEWNSPARPFKKRSKEFFRTAAALVFLVAVVLVFAGEFLLIGVIAAVFFVVYALSSVPPENLHHKITTLGIDTGGFFHRWEELYEFWFDERNDQAMLVVRTLLNFPSHLLVLLNDAPAEKIKAILSERIPFKETPERTLVDRTASWLIKKIPFERTS